MSNRADPAEVQENPASAIVAVADGGIDPAAAEFVVLDREEIGSARRYADASRAVSTQRAYASDWRRFSAWCAARNLDTLPADPRAVTVFLAAEADAGSAPLTIGRRLAAIGWMHRRAGLQPPQAREGAAAILEVMAGIRRSHGVAPAKKHAADADVLGDILRAIPGDDLRSVRDRALLVFGMAGAFRRSELVALRLADVERVPEGLRVTIRRGKTDQEAAGAIIAIPEGRRLRPKALLDAWLERAAITDGFLFRRLGAGASVTASPMSDRAIARLVQARAAAARYQPADFAGHSLRAGFLTAAARSGASVFKMREVVTAQIDAGAGRLCPRRGTVPRPRRGKVPVAMLFWTSGAGRHSPDAVMSATAGAGPVRASGTVPTPRPMQPGRHFAASVGRRNGGATSHPVWSALRSGTEK